MSKDPHAGENREWMRAEQERRRSSVAQPHRNRSKYHRASSKRQARRDAQTRTNPS